MASNSGHWTGAVFKLDSVLRGHFWNIELLHSNALAKKDVHPRLSSEHRVLVDHVCVQRDTNYTFQYTALLLMQCTDKSSTDMAKKTSKSVMSHCMSANKSCANRSQQEVVAPDTYGV